MNLYSAIKTEYKKQREVPAWIDPFEALHNHNSRLSEKARYKLIKYTINTSVHVFTTLIKSGSPSNLATSPHSYV